MPHRLQVIIFLFLILFLGCTPKKPAPEQSPSALWSRFWRNQTQNILSFKIKTSINYSSARHKNRILATMWGNLNYPIRMNIEAGIGQTISLWREDMHLWQAYFPTQKTLYIHPDGQKGATALGYPTPFNLKELAMILLGHYRSIVPDQFDKVELKNGLWVFSFDSRSKVKKLALSELARPVFLTGDKWQAKLNQYIQEQNNVYAQKIILLLPRSEQAVIRIKSVQIKKILWEDQQLALNLPEDTIYIRMKDEL
ncbi:hypothetical protein [Desulfovulcanus sp.]